MPKVNNGQVIMAKEAVQGLANRRDIPAKYHVALLRWTRKFIDELAAVQDARNSIILKYAGEEGTTVNVDDEHYKDCLKEVSDLMLEESKLDEELVKIPGTVTKDGAEQDIFIDGADLLMLEPFIEIIEG
uniref:Uncharacterized protein n=1 Tax=viral metagenome TaxID=1070528 RepID=A0A6M3KD15_9ZZZZ